jgi:hypothetical protein
MSTRAPHTATGLVERLLTRIEEWTRGNEMASLSRDELDRMASDVGVTADDLSRLAQTEPDAARLMYARLAGLGCSMDDIERSGVGVRRDMERTCALCGDRPLCAHDLAERPDSEEWRRICPNNGTFEMMERLAAATR